MRKLTSLLMLWLLCLSSSMQAQVKFHQPGEALDLTSDAVTVGTDVFIYSMYVNTEDETTTNNSRLIVATGDNVVAWNKAPGGLVTSNGQNVWRIASKSTETYAGGTVIKITFKRNKGADSKYLGIDGSTNNESAGDDQTFCFTQWLNTSTYVDGTYTATSQKCDANGANPSDITASDYVYLMAANGKAVSTAEGSYSGSGTVGTPVMIYSVVESTALAPNLKISTAPADGAWNANTTWYKIKQKGQYYWNINPDYTEGNGYIKLTCNTNPTNEPAALWCVTGNVNDGYSFYNMLAGPDVIFATSGSGGGAVSTLTADTNGKVTKFDFGFSNEKTGFYIKDHGSNNNYLNWRDAYLAHWDTSLGYGDEGSKCEFVEVTADDVTNAAAAAKTLMLERLAAWKNITLLSGITDIHTTLNGNTETTTDGILAAVRTAQTAFATAVDGQRITLTSGVTSTSDTRCGRVLALNASIAHGKLPAVESDEIITLKASPMATVQLYNEFHNTYVANPGNSAAVNKAGGARFYLQIAATDPVANVAAFKSKSADMLYLSNNSENDYALTNQVDFSDPASLWTFAAVTDAYYARINLKQQIADATSVRDGMQSFITSHTADLASTTSSCLTSLTSAIADATTVANTSSSEASVYTTAQSTLASALLAARQGFFASLGQTRYNLKLNTTSRYMKVGCLVNDNNEGNAQLASLTEGSVEQSFSLVAGSGENANKIYLQTDGRQLKNLGARNTEMAAAGTAYLFEDTDIAAGIVRIRNIANESDENKKYIGTNSGNTADGAHVFTDKASGDPTEWVLVPVNKVSVRLALAAAYEQIKAWYDANSTKALNSTAEVWPTLSSALTTAEAQASESNLESNTIADIAAAHDALIEAYDAVVASYQSNASQKFRMRLHSTVHGDNCYMQVLGTDVKQISVSLNPFPESKRVFTMQKEGDYFHILNGTNTLQYSATDADWWNVKFAEGTASNWKITRPVGQWSRFYIRKEIANNVFFSPHNPQEADGSYLVFSNLGDRNTWEFELLANDDEVSETNAYMQRALALYEQYRPYYDLYDANKAGLPGYPTNASTFFDQTFDNLVLKLAHPSGIDEHDVLTWKNLLPNMVPVLANYPTNRYFIIHNNDNRGDVYYYNSADADGTTGEGLSAAYLWSTGKSGATPDKGDATYQWCFLPHEKEDGSKEYYLYNVGKKQYARPTKKDDHPGEYCWVFTDEPAPVTLTWRTGHELYITAQSMEDKTPKDVYMSMSNAYTGPLTAYTDDNLTDGGLRFTFDWATPTEVDAAVTSAVTALVQNDVKLKTIGETSLITGLTGEQTTIRTFSSTKAFNVPEGVTAYIATTQIEGSTTFIDLQAVPAEEAVPAQQGVLLIGNDTQATLPVNYRPATGEFTWANNKFLSTATGGVEMTSGCYILANGAEGIGIYASSTGTLSQGKAYLKLDGSATSNRLVMRFNGVETSIENLLPALCGEQGAVYDLSGRRVNTVQKGGVYIQNGKKFIYK